MARYAAVGSYASALWGVLMGLGIAKASGGDVVTVILAVTCVTSVCGLALWAQWPNLRSADERLERRLSCSRGDS